MCKFPGRKIVERLREEFPVGTKIELVEMNDPYSRLVPGDTGTVSYIDDIGTIHVNWERGSSLGLVYDKDKYKKIE
jgi:hypothetical protein